MGSSPSAHFFFGVRCNYDDVAEDYYEIAEELGVETFISGYLAADPEELGIGLKELSYENWDGEWPFKNDQGQSILPVATPEQIEKIKNAAMQMGFDESSLDLQWHLFASYG